MEFTVKGQNFFLLPVDIVGTISNDNDNPLQWKDLTQKEYYCRLVSKSDNELVFSAQGSTGHSALYLGAICSNDRETIYWTNVSRPLP